MRQHARQQARAALRAVLADAYGLPSHVIQLDDQRGVRVRATLAADTPAPPGWQTLGLSISHADSVVLIALCAAGPVGVDVAVLPPDWATGGDEALRQQAALYLGPAHPAAQAPAEAQADAGAQFGPFVQGWAALEARLKCLEQPLVEWSPALAARLARCHSATLHLPPAVRQALPAISAAAVAWAAQG